MSIVLGLSSSSHCAFYVPCKCASSLNQVMNEDGHTASIKDKILTIIVKPGWNEGTRITL